MVSHRFLLSQTASRPILGAVVVSKPSAFPIGEPVPRRWTRRTLRDAAGTRAPPKVQRTGVPRSCQQAARKRWRLAHLPARCDVRSAPAAPLAATGPAGCGAALSQSFDPEPDFGEADADNPLLDRHDNHRRPAIFGDCLRSLLARPIDDLAEPSLGLGHRPDRRLVRDGCLVSLGSLCRASAMQSSRTRLLTRANSDRFAATEST